MFETINPCGSGMNGRKRTIDDSRFTFDRCSWHSNQRKNKKHRGVRRVHFTSSGVTGQDDPLDENNKKMGPLHVTTYNVENIMNLVEKDEIWFPSHSMHKFLSIRNDWTLCQEQRYDELSSIPPSSFDSTYTATVYSNAIEASYYRCCQDSDNGNELYDHCKLSLAAVRNMKDCTNDVSYSNDISFDYQLIGLHRGMEMYCVPALGIARVTVRKNMIHNVIMVDQVLRNDPRRTDLLACIATQLTIPSKRFAHMFGIVDAMNAALANNSYFDR